MEGQSYFRTMISKMIRQTEHTMDLKAATADPWQNIPLLEAIAK